MTVYRKGPVELRLGDYREVLADVECDAVITDPPYSERTHAGALSTTHERGVRGYRGWAAAEAEQFAAWCDGVAQSWVVIHTDDVLGPIYIQAMRYSLGRYAFPLVPVLQHQPRVQGDGPSQHGHYMAVSRPTQKRFMGWGSLPGWYQAPRDGTIVRGGKPIGLMRAIVRHYTRPGDQIVDPCVGGGTTLIAAALEGRRAIGAELDPKTFETACARIERHALTPPLPGLEADPMIQAEIDV